jgi:hypothetical protein
MSQLSPPVPGDSAACAVRGARMLPPLIAFGVIYVAAMAALRFIPLPRAAQYAVALLPAPFFAFYLRRWIHAARGLDELQRLIHFEALAIAYPLVLLLLMVLGLLDLVRLPDRSTNAFLRVWPVVFWLYVVGLFIARKRYR